MKDGIFSFGPPWRRLVIDARRGLIRAGFRRKVKLDDVRSLQVLEHVNAFEVDQLLNLHPDVQKQPRAAELWAELKSGERVLLGEAPQAGLLIHALAPLAAARQLPLVTERGGPVHGSERAPKAT